MQYSVTGKDQHGKVYNIQSTYPYGIGWEIVCNDGTVIRVVECKESVS